MRVFSADVKLYATAYIKAETEEKAKALFLEHFGTQAKSENIEDVREIVDGSKLDDEDLPEVSLSPCMTAYGTGGEDLSFDEYDPDEEAEGQDRESYTDDQDRKYYSE